jgi:hypothetical protein
MRIAYSVPGAVSTAFAPVPAWDGRGCGPWSNSAAIEGQPGTMGVPVGVPDFGAEGQVVNGVPVRGGGGGYAQGSGTMPGPWYPQLYWLRQLDGATLVSGNAQTPSVYSDNQMPVPAADPVGRAAVLAAAPVFLGQAQVRQPSGSKGPAWPSWLPGRGYGG